MMTQDNRVELRRAALAVLDNFDEFNHWPDARHIIRCLDALDTQDQEINRLHIELTSQDRLVIELRGWLAEAERKLTDREFFTDYKTT